MGNQTRQFLEMDPSRSCAFKDRNFPSTHNFNGLVRHYYLRGGPNVSDTQGPQIKIPEGYQIEKARMYLSERRMYRRAAMPSSIPVSMPTSIMA